MTILERREKRGIEKGKKIGMREGVEKIAYNLLKMGFDVKTVAEGTELSLEQVRKMQKEIEKNN